MNAAVQPAGAPAARSLTGYLLSALGDVRPPHHGVVAIYTEAYDLDAVDPREFVLRTARRTLVRPNQSVGFGRAPYDVDHPVVVGELGELVDSVVPRMAARVFREGGAWYVENRSTKNFVVTLTGPDHAISLRSGQPPERLRSHRQIVCARARRRHPDGGSVAVEHRLTVILPDLLHPVSTPAPAVAPVGTVGTETASTKLKTWSRHQRRTLVGHFYPELVGLPPHSYVREYIADQLMDLPPKEPGQKSRHERVLKTIRDQAAKATGQSMTGRTGTGHFEQFVLAHRDLLEDDLVDLHRAYRG